MLVLLSENLKADYVTKIVEIEKEHDHDLGNKYIQEINKLTTENFEVRLKQAKLATKADVANLVKKNQILMIN